ncbi:NUDIX hydrolase [Occultella glacieicola]|uniref:NUDIX hydrolase n=1 Tax=Occultella glacieicola TaxID=2518684 RepID=A0ABY2EC63_9MICO|nr:NUDIX hydrolase [Occultella glacieicola]TDE98757.1 NUDIX hydrolase [Occultella glacieicola]
MSAAAPTPRPRAPRPPVTRLRRTHAHSLPVVDETSAGGLVVRVVGGAAFTAVIARRNRAGRLEWCLPKGHLEGAETAEEAAVREIAEETGIEGQVLRHLATIDYWFAGSDRRVHKVVHHYLLEALGGELTTENDPDHEAEAVAWVALSDVAARLAYPNERRVVATARDMLTGRS